MVRGESQPFTGLHPHWEIGSAAALSGETPRGDPAINALRQARRDSATAADAADICISILAILERRSEASLGDHEAQLAEEYLQAGLSSVMAGRVDEAIDRFVNAQRVSETLSALTPGAAVHKLRLAVALTMRGLLPSPAGAGGGSRNCPHARCGNLPRT